MEWKLTILQWDCELIHYKSDGPWDFSHCNKYDWDYPVGQSLFDMKMTEKQDKCPIEMKF